jgi:hypothetical protein
VKIIKESLLEQFFWVPVQTNWAGQKELTVLPAHPDAEAQRGGRI